MTRPGAPAPLFVDADGWRLLVAPDAGGNWTLSGESRDGPEEPRALLAVRSPLVSGAGLRLTTRASRVTGAGGSLRIQGQDEVDGGGGCRWEVAFAPVDSGPLVRVDLALAFDAEAELVPDRDPQGDPAVIVWVMETDRLDVRQTFDWHKTLLRFPTRNGQGVRGNDLAAVYLYDPVARAQTVVHFDLSRAAWFADLRGFTRYDTGLVVRQTQQGPVRYGVGLYGAQGPAAPFRPGELRLTWYVGTQGRAASPTAWEALEVLVDWLAPVFAPAVPIADPSWKDIAAGTVEDVMRPETTVRVAGLTGQRAYVAGSSRVWGTVEDSFELMTQVDVALPALLYLRLHPDPRLAAHVDTLLDSLTRFWRRDFGYLTNTFPWTPGADERIDTWYLLENALIKCGWIALLTGRRDLQAAVIASLRWARALAHQCNHLFPLFCRGKTASPVAQSLNVSAGGLYAYGAVVGYRLDGGRDLLAEAASALTAMHSAPVELLHHEPQQLGFAALAAMELSRLEPDPRWRRMADDFLRAQLAMAYWHEDVLASAAGYRVQGGFQACASILYPAMKENVESIVPWVALMRMGEPAPVAVMLRVLAAQRANNAYFYPRFLPAGTFTDGGGCPSIPLENLAMAEPSGAVGEVGQEVYGAGEGLFMHLIFDALARSEHPGVLVASLDVLDLERPTYPPSARSFLLARLGPERVAARIRFFALDPRTTYRIAPGAASPRSGAALMEEGVDVELSGERPVRLELTPES